VFLHNNEDQFRKVGETGRNKGKIAFNSRFQAFFNGFMGRLTILGQGHKNCFGKHTPKYVFFSINRRFWDSFWGG
jgi:hypothetical protein